MAERVDEKKMLKELIEIYQRFLDENTREEAIDEAIAYDRRFGGLATEHYEKYISSTIRKAIGGLSTIYQYGMRPHDKGYSNKELIDFAKKILEELKKAEEKDKEIK